MEESNIFRLPYRDEEDLEMIFELHHDELLLVIWKIFPDWKIAEEILREVFARIKQSNLLLPNDEEQRYNKLALLCRKTTIENIPFLSGNSGV
jgi:hypothetical protein